MKSEKRPKPALLDLYGTQARHHAKVPVRVRYICLVILACRGGVLFRLTRKGARGDHLAPERTAAGGCPRRPELHACLDGILLLAKHVCTRQSPARGVQFSSARGVRYTYTRTRVLWGPAGQPQQVGPGPALAGWWGGQPGMWTRGARQLGAAALQPEAPLSLVRRVSRHALIQYYA